MNESAIVGGAGERLGRLVGVGLDRRDAQALDVLEETRRAALAQHPTEERAEHAHVGAHPLGDLLAGLESSDEVDRFGLGELAHALHASAAVFRGRHVLHGAPDARSLDARCAGKSGRR